MKANFDSNLEDYTQLKKSQVKECKVGFLVSNFSNTITRSNDLIESIRKETGDEILEFLSSRISLSNQQQVLFTSKSEKFYDKIDYNNIKAVINLDLVNKHQDINQWFCSINNFLPDQGFYAGCVETYQNRKQKITHRYGKQMAKVIELGDFIFNRVISRLKYTKGIYKFITNNKYKALSLAETLGRFVYCGFEVIDYKEVNGLMYFVVKKKCEPKNFHNVPDGLIFSMNRIGKHGKLIKVYKVRTMHPYSEFLQDFIVKRNGYNHLGKPANDFRLTAWGKIFRKLWLDEIPQIINVIKGDLALVGVRPLSQVRYNQFPEDLKEERIKHKPGCIPPYVSLCMPDSKENIEAERIYLREMTYDPHFNNLKYFLMAVYNILANKIRSN
jgi:hypothetical protein